MDSYAQQTSTSDMLDLAVQYIRDLQGQLQVCFYLIKLYRLMHALLQIEQPFFFFNKHLVLYS